MLSWDPAKNESNRRKHGVSFEEACHVFRDPLHISLQDRVEGGEQRWQTLGRVGDAIVLLIVHTWSDVDNGEEHIRIISARKADRTERRRYEEAS